MGAVTRVWSVALHGVDGVPVEVETAIGGGIPAVHLVGLPDAALNEAKDRVRSAIVNSGRNWPNERIVLALSPATLRKTGSRFDLALACGILTAAGAVPPGRLHGTALLGELALDGRLRPVRGVLPCLLAARDAGMTRAVVPRAVLPEAALVDDLDSYGADTLADVLDWAAGHEVLGLRPPDTEVVQGVVVPELADVIGQDDARHALEIAAAGGHHLLMVGPPGTGKTMLAQRIVGLLPDLDRASALQLAAIRSVAGRLGEESSPLSTLAPFVAPHHSASAAALLGGGSGVARPGAVSLAHRGVLFLDECPHWSTTILDSLRTPLEEGEVRLARADGTVRYPARFQLVLAVIQFPTGVSGLVVEVFSDMIRTVVGRACCRSAGRERRTWLRVFSRLVRQCPDSALPRLTSCLRSRYAGSRRISFGTRSRGCSPGCVSSRLWMPAS